MHDREQPLDSTVWVLPEKFTGVEEILQKDIKAGLLALKTPPGHEQDLYQPHPSYAALIFGSSEKPIESIESTGYETHIMLQREERQDIVVDRCPDEDGAPIYAQVRFLFGQDYGNESLGKQYSTGLAGSFYGWETNLATRSAFIMYDIYGHLVKQNPLATPRIITFGTLFDGLEEAGEYKDNSPFISLNRVFTGEGKIADLKQTEGWKISVSPESDLHAPRNGYEVAISDKIPQAYFVNKERGLVYTVTWGVENGIITLEQIQREGPTPGVTKILTCPLFIDLNPVTAALAVRPPYEKDENGQYIMPWRQLDRALGVRLGYIYPSTTLRANGPPPERKNDDRP